MAAASYYDTADAQVEKTQLSPSRGPQFTGMHPEGSTQGVGQELHEGGGGQRGFPRQGYNEQVQDGMPQQASNEQYLHQGSYGQNSGVHGGQQQQMGQQQIGNNNNYTQGGGQQQIGNINYTQGGGQQQQMGQQQMSNNNYIQGGGQQMNSTGEQAAVADDRDTMTKCNDNPPDSILELLIIRSLPLRHLTVRHCIRRCLVRYLVATDHCSYNSCYLTSSLVSTQQGLIGSRRNLAARGSTIPRMRKRMPG